LQHLALRLALPRVPRQVPEVESSPRTSANGDDDAGLKLS
jgi:hypothetical protein